MNLRLQTNRTGKIVVSENLNDVIDNNSATYDYYIGMLGDVDNDGVINDLDVLLIQEYISDMIIFTDEEKAVADINGDGYITISNVSMIQSKIADIITEFSKGAFICLG